MFDSLWLHGLQQTRLPCPPLSPRIFSNSCPLNWWCHPTISSSVVPYSSRSQTFPASGSFLMSQLFASGGQSIGVSALAISPSNEYSWLISFRIDWIDLLASKGLSRVFSSTTIWKHQFFGTQSCFELWQWNHQFFCAQPSLNFPGGSVVKNPPANAGDTGVSGLIPA